MCRSVTTPALPLPPSVTETRESAVWSSSQADGVRAACGVVNGGAGGLRHSPFIPNLLPIVAAPESHCDIVVPGQGDGLLWAKRSIVHHPSVSDNDSTSTFSGVLTV